MSNSPTRSARALTFSEVATHVIGMLMTWEELIPLLEQSRSVNVTFEIMRDGVSSRGSVAVDPREMITRARNGIQWAAGQGQLQQIRVSATTDGTLWIG